jgi:UMF1 family MFS transporter
MVMMPEWYGISDGSLPHFLSVGIWWIGFAQITFITFPIIFSQESEKTISLRTQRA